MDFVWMYLAKEEKGRELQFSVRSVIKNYRGSAKIWIVCTKEDFPAWASRDVRHIPYVWRKDRQSRRPWDLTEKIAAACRSHKVGECFVSMYDDLYFLRPFDLSDIDPPYLGKKWTRLEFSKWRPRGQWQRRVKKSVKAFMRTQNVAYDFSLHMPFVFNKQDFLACYKRWRLDARPYLRETTYFSEYPPSEIRKLPKGFYFRMTRRMGVRALREQVKGATIFNHTSHRYGKAVQTVLGEHFPEPCRVEQDAKPPYLHDAGVILLANAKAEWMLPWWWENYSEYNKFPVTLFDAGLSTTMRKWAEQRMRVTSFEPVITGPPRSAQCFSYNKPLVMELTPYHHTQYLDLDIEVCGKIDYLFRYCSSPPAMPRDPFAVTLHKGTHCAGHVCYARGDGTIKKWAELCRTGRELANGDQQLYFKMKLPVTTIPCEESWTRLCGEDGTDVILRHWTSGTGARHIRRLIKKDGRTPEKSVDSC